MQTALSPVTNHFTQVLPDHRTSNGVLFFSSKVQISLNPNSTLKISAISSHILVSDLIGNCILWSFSLVSEKAKAPWKDSNKKKSFSSTFVLPLPADPNGPESMSVGSRLCQFLFRISLDAQKSTIGYMSPLLNCADMFSYGISFLKESYYFLRLNPLCMSGFFAKKNLASLGLGIRRKKPDMRLRKITRTCGPLCQLA